MTRRNKGRRDSSRRPFSVEARSEAGVAVPAVRRSPVGQSASTPSGAPADARPVSAAGACVEWVAASSAARALRSALPAILLAAAVLVPMAGKAFTIDDPLFLRQAQHALGDPLHPTSAVMVWSEVPQPMRLSQIMPGGPVMAWLLVPTILAGGSEVVAHLTQLVLLVVALVAVAVLALRLEGDEQQARSAALLLAATPAVLGMAGTAMPDVAAMALGVLGVERLVAWRQQGHAVAGFAAAVTLALAPLARSHAGLLVGLSVFLLDPPWRAWRQWLPVGGAVALAAALLWLTHDPLGGSSDIARSAGLFSSVANLRSNLVAFGLHWVFVLPLALAWMIARAARFWRSPLPYACAFAASAVVAASPLGAWLWIAPAAGLGIAVVLDVFVEALQQRDRARVALAAWLVVALPVAVYLHFPSKYLVVSAPAAAILSARALATLPRRAGRALLVGLVAAGAAFGLAILRADATFAGLGRRAAAELVAPYVARGERVWFNANWGFQWYAERAGARIVTRTPPHPRAGDLLVSAQQTVTGIPLRAFPRRELVATVSEDAPGGRIMSAPLGAGFYSNGWGFLPWAWGSGEVDRFELWRLR